MIEMTGSKCEREKQRDQNSARNPRPNGDTVADRQENGVAEKKMKETANEVRK